MLKISDGIPRWPMTQKKNQSCDALTELFLRAELGSLNVHHTHTSRVASSIVTSDHLT